jgi:hypothetical protein
MYCRFVSAEPDVSRLQLMPLQDEFVILASDGLWDVISSKEACEIVKVRPSKVYRIFFPAGGRFPTAWQITLSIWLHASRMH